MKTKCPKCKGNMRVLDVNWINGPKSSFYVKCMKCKEEWDLIIKSADDIELVEIGV